MYNQILFFLVLLLFFSVLSTGCATKEDGLLVIRNETPMYLVGKTYTTNSLKLQDNFGVSPNDKLVLSRYHISRNEQTQYLRQLVQLQLQSNNCVIYLDEKEIADLATGGPNIVIHIKKNLFNNCN